MENRLQHILLTIALAGACAISSAKALADADYDNEFVEFGLSAGVLNIEDFGSEPSLGASLTVKASEDFFLQVNYLQAEAALSSFEKSQGQLFSGSDRDFQHYDLLLGVNLFQAEFGRGGEPDLASFYLVGGVGDTTFGGEQSFTYTVGAGYQWAIWNNYLIKLDYRDYFYQTSLMAEEKTVHNGHISLGMSYVF
ncbi:outer membrane beta-barrel domain-containing protein [Teredinibacter turnerae]|uniref:outer membrane beta-barrel domain-containing protein n=1 Tax=Teredinibacter turnerae TaxID=2426 RepID=UPI00037433E1|nr:outer membrane beta-barrel domain-containing protein [Teredinibacter turnerae]